MELGHLGGDAVFERRFLRLDGFTKVERIQMIARVSEAINQAGAWITPNMFLSCITNAIPIAPQHQENGE